MRQLFTLAVAVISAIALGSCDKEDGGTSGDLVGTWRITKHEYKFDGKTVGVEIPIEDYDTGTCTFENGGKCSIGGVPIKYSYSASNHTLELTMIIKTSYDVLKLTYQKWCGRIFYIRLSRQPTGIKKLMYITGMRSLNAMMATSILLVTIIRKEVISYLAKK